MNKSTTILNHSLASIPLFYSINLVNMAQKSAKSLAVRNAKRLNQTHITTITIHTISLLLRLLRITSKLSRRSIGLHFLLSAPALAVEFWLEKSSRPVYRADGTFRAGDDLDHGGVMDWCWDVIYWSWGCVAASGLLGDKAWYLWLTDEEQMSGGSIRPSCPSGGTWFICASTPSQFVGCCKTDPCRNASGCPSIDLTPATFEPDSYGTFPNQTCAAGAGDFYTCTFTGENKTPFIGCCRTNACQQGGCPASDLGAAGLAVNSEKSQPFITAVGGLGVVSSATVMSTVTTNSKSATSSRSSTITTTSSSSQSSASSSSLRSLPTSSSQAETGIVIIPTGIGDPFSPGSSEPAISTRMSKGSIAGLTIAGVVLITALAAIVFFICTRHRRMAQTLQGQKSLSSDSEASNGPEPSSGGLFTPERRNTQTEQARSSMRPPTLILPAFAKSRGHTGNEGRHSYTEQGGYGDHPAGRFYNSPSPHRNSPAPPYDPRYSTPPSFPPHPALGTLHNTLLHPHQQQTLKTGGNGYAVPMLPPHAWPATSLAPVPEAAADDEELEEEDRSIHSSSTVMVAAGTESPKPSNVAKEYTANVMLARSPPSADYARWSARRSMVGEVYDDDDSREHHR